MAGSAFPSRFHQLTHEHAKSVIYRCVSGSQAYGTAGPGADTDMRGIYVLPPSAYLALDAPPEQLSDDRHNEVYYALRRFCELASTANPNIIELLFVPPDCVTLRTPCSDRLVEARGLFLSKRAFESHVAYALAQIKKARGQNKWVNNPKPETPPAKEDFCWIVPREIAGGDEAPILPYRPVSPSEAGVDLAQCHAAALEHCPGVFRLYRYGAEAKGVFREGNLVCESIPKEDESARCIGLLIFNRAAYEKALADHRHYWTWRRTRNEARWIGQEAGAIDYDAKNLMHTFRLILSAEHIFREGAPLVRFEGEALRFLLSVRAGDYAYADLVRMVEEKVAQLDDMRARSTLPDGPDVRAIENLLAEIAATWEATDA